MSEGSYVCSTAKLVTEREMRGNYVPQANYTATKKYLLRSHFFGQSEEVP
jgi:hypothetical protein